MTRSESPAPPSYPRWAFFTLAGDLLREQSHELESPGVPVPGELLWLDLGAMKLIVDPEEDGASVDWITTVERYVSGGPGPYRGGRRIGVGLPHGCRLWVAPNEAAMVLTGGGYERALKACWAYLKARGVKRASGD